MADLIAHDQNSQKDELTYWNLKPLITNTVLFGRFDVILAYIKNEYK